MLHEPIEDLTPPARARTTPRFMLAAGVAGAVALGVGAGLWARPADNERRAMPEQVSQPAPQPRPTRQIEIVLDDTPAPIGAPIEVLPAMDGQPTQDAPPMVDAMPMAPVRPPAGLVRVQAVEPVEPVVIEPKGPSPAELRRAEQREAEARAAERKAEKAQLRAEKAEKAEKAALAKAKLEKADRAKLEKAKAKAGPKKPDRKLAKTDEPKAKAINGKSKAELAKAEKAEKAKLAKLEAAEKAEKAKAKRAFAKLGKALGKVVPHRAKAAEDAGKLASQTERKARTAKPKVEKAVVKRAPKPERPRVDRDAGPLRKVSNKGGCVSSDPGAALVCADPSLGAADRQMTRAYREAEAAGVPAWRLQQQHQRWLAARSAAAREAPWAVQDVYSARIAELRDQARDAGAY